jgi:UDPglucose--hexose-1-phosphate uridylyltransferase
VKPAGATRAAYLADGREIFYFDESPAPEAPVDPRRLPRFEPEPTIRHDPLTGEWITVAGHRQDRTHLPPADACPLCPSRDGRQTEIPGADYDVVVIENRFPSFAGPAEDGPEDAAAWFRERRAAGRCEVICFSSDHAAAVSELAPGRMRTVLEAWTERSATLAALPFVEEVFCFENRGEEIGVTLSHPHGQIYAYPFVTPRTEHVLSRASGYQRRTGRNLFVDLLQAEVRSGDRVVLARDEWTAFVPFAARWPLEIHLHPNRRTRDFSELTEVARDEFAEVYLELLKRVEASFGAGIPYIAAWHQAPVRRHRDLAQLHLQFFSIRRAPGKIKYLAGSESAMGAFINDRSPEETARRLREVVL